MLIVVGVFVGLVGLACSSQVPPSEEKQAATAVPAAAPAPLREACDVEVGPLVASAIILPDPNSCGFKIHPKKICAKSGGTIYWLVDTRQYPDRCARLRPRPDFFRLRNFRLHGGGDEDPFAGGTCDMEIRKIHDTPGAGNKVYLMECVLGPESKDKHYDYEAVPFLGTNELDPVDPEIQVRG